MKKAWRIIILLLAVALLVSCGKGKDGTTGEADDPNASGSPDNGAEPQKDVAGMTATVTAVSEKIEVSVINGDYGASGPYLVIVSDGTTLIGKNGEGITRDDIRVGDTVEIRYGGQVMMSYPPQIVAAKITVVG